MKMFYLKGQLIKTGSVIFEDNQFMSKHSLLQKYPVPSNSFHV